MPTSLPKPAVLFFCMLTFPFALCRSLAPRTMSDLSTMNVGTLRQRAVSAGVAAQQIENARDSDDPKGELIALINNHAAAAASVARPALSTMSAGTLRQHAESAGVPAWQIEVARDSDDPKSELIKLINNAAATPAPSAAAATPATVIAVTAQPSATHHHALAGQHVQVEHKRCCNDKCLVNATTALVVLVTWPLAGLTGVLSLDASGLCKDVKESILGLAFLAGCLGFGIILSVSQWRTCGDGGQNSCRHGFALALSIILIIGEVIHGPCHNVTVFMATRNTRVLCQQCNGWLLS
jgi:hypothetical protein